MADIRQQFSLSEIGGSTLALGQAAMAASLPVTLASNQPPVSVTESAYKGISSYFSGSAGTVTVPSGARIVSISTVSDPIIAATLNILGGTSITIPQNTAFSEGYTGFVGPGTIVFTNTVTYYVALNQ